MRILTFGEIMLRLRAPNHERLFQSNMLEATFGGGEANVAVSLANFGMNVQYCTILPENIIGDECIRELRRFGVDTSKVLRSEGRMGIYFLENLQWRFAFREKMYSTMFRTDSVKSRRRIDSESAMIGCLFFCRKRRSLSGRVYN